MAEIVLDSAQLVVSMEMTICGIVLSLLLKYKKTTRPAVGDY